MDDKREIKVESESFRKLDNFWYYYKWHVIVSLFVILVLVVCTVQACSREKEDICILYAGGSFIDAEYQSEIGKTLSSVIPSDFDGDGTKRVGFINYQIYSQEEIEELEKLTLPDGSKNVVDRARNSSNMTTYSSYMMTGEVSVCFLSPYLFENMKKSDRLVPLSEIFDEIPDSACDEYGVLLSDTDLYAYNSSIRAMDGETVVCLMKQTVIGKSSNDKAYQNAVDTFKAIVQFVISQ